MFLIWFQEKDESKTLTKDISCKWKHIADGGKCNLNQKWTNNTCFQKMVTWDKIIDAEENETIPTSFNKKAIGKTKKFYILLVILLIIIALLVAVSIYCYLIKYRAKQIYSLPFYAINNKLKQILYKHYKLKWVMNSKMRQDTFLMVLSR